MHRMWDWLTLLLVLAGIFLFLRPGSNGPTLVDTIGTTFVNLINAATGGGGWSGKK